jgi:two-component system, cell cycle sensor histidine kinase and response regulator CckA
MSGKRLAELLLEQQPDLPVLFMSGYSSGLLSNSNVLADDVTFIEKPFTATALLQKLASVSEQCEQPARH